MDNLLSFFTDIRKTVALSTGLHVLLAIILLLWKTGFDLDASEYAEVSFVSNTSMPSETPAPARQTIQQQEPVQQPPEATDTETAPEEQNDEPPAEESQEIAQVPVELPQRRMLEDEEPLIRDRSADRVPDQTGVGDIPRRDDLYTSRETGEVSTDRSAGERLTASPQSFDVEDRGIQPTTDVGSPASSSQPFTIEGKAAERSILKQVIPEYPPGLDKEAVIKIRFTVLPDGRIGQMIPVQKDYPQLEEVTINALKQWRFNPLPPSAEQTNVQGVITFRYELM